MQNAYTKAKKLLPLGTKNNVKENLRNEGYSKCKVLEGEFHLTEDEAFIFRTKEERRRLYHFILKKTYRAT